MGTLSKLRRMVLRDGLSIREASRKLSISRTTAAKWVAQDQMIEPRYSSREPAASILDMYKDQLALWLKADRPRQTRPARHQSMFEAIQSMGYQGSRGPVYTWCQRWLQE